MVACYTLSFSTSTSPPTSLAPTPTPTVAFQPFAASFTAAPMTKTTFQNTSLLALSTRSSTAIPPTRPPFHITSNDVSTPPRRLTVASISGHQVIRGRGGVIAVLYKTHWNSLLCPSWGRELDFHPFRRHILLDWAGTPVRHRQGNRQYRPLRSNAPQRQLSWSHGK